MIVRNFCNKTKVGGTPGRSHCQIVEEDLLIKPECWFGVKEGVEDIKEPTSEEKSQVVGIISWFL